MRHDDLRLFLAIANARSMRRAAEQLGTTQSALTKAVRRLEAELHTRLFDRAPRGVELTEPGRAFHARMKQVDIGVSQALHELEHMRMGELGLVRLGCTAANFETLVKPALQNFLKSRPMARFALSLEISSRLTDLLMDGRLDLVVAGSAPSAPPELEQLKLYDETMHAVVRAGHPLLRADATVQDLTQSSWLLPPPGRVLRHWVERRLSELSASAPRIAIESDGTMAVLSSMVRDSDLVSATTGRMLGSSAGAGLQALDHLAGSGQAPLLLSWRRDSYLSPLAQDLRDSLRTIASAHRDQAM
ncbi:MAG: LysR family transcriptional regulator [Burkholderiaceae bacterium]